MSWRHQMPKHESRDSSFSSYQDTFKVFKKNLPKVEFNTLKKQGYSSVLNVI